MTYAASVADPVSRGSPASSEVSADTSSTVTDDGTRPARSGCARTIVALLSSSMYVMRAAGRETSSGR